MSLKIIPAIDLSEGQCVRLRQGDYAAKTVYGDPLQMARDFEGTGLPALHLVDLDGAKAGSPQNLEVLRQICETTDLEVDFGGGLRKKEDVARSFEAGAQQVTVGSIAARQPEVLEAWLEEFGAETFILGADAKQGKIAVGGWLEKTELDLVEFIAAWEQRDISTVLCTAIERDGMLSGPDFSLYSQLMTRFPQLNLIASGGVSNAADLDRLNEMGMYGVVVGKAIYEGKITLEELKARC